MKRRELEEIIMEELQKALSERGLNEAEFTSAGTVPRVHKRKMTPAQIQRRDTLGRKILKAISSGSDESNPLRRAFIKWAQDNDHPIDSEEKMNSYAWAMASDFAIKGKSFPPKGKKK